MLGFKKGDVCEVGSTNTGGYYNIRIKKKAIDDFEIIGYVNGKSLRLCEDTKETKNEEEWQQEWGSDYIDEVHERILKTTRKSTRKEIIKLITLLISLGIKIAFIVDIIVLNIKVFNS